MTKILRFLATAAVSAAMFALPAAASAGVWHAEPSTAATPFTAAATGHGHFLTGTASSSITCKGNATEPSSTGTGSFDIGGTTGKISLSYFGCESSGTACTTPGQASGVIVTTANLVVHNILLEAGPPKIPGVLITGSGAAKQFAHYTCGFGLVTVNVTGDVIGEVEQACGTKGKVFSLNFQTAGGVQKWQQETTTGTKFDLTTTVNGKAETGFTATTFTVNFGAAERTITCT